MIHALCDFCGKDTDRNAVLLSLTPFRDFARYHTDTEPYGTKDETRSFVICDECMRKHRMPNPYETYSGITAQKLEYGKALHNYTDSDLLEDGEHDKKPASE